jgi:anaerobic selenocysteine-containing dehydrogenase
MISFPVSYRKYEETDFRTPSGKIELKSSILEGAGYEPLPHHIEPPESPVSTPDLAEEFPLILTNFRHKAYEHTEYRQIAPLRELLPEPLIEINPITASQLGINEGDEVWVETPKFSSRVTAKADLVHELHPRVVALLFGWWFPEKEAPEHGCFEANVNAIIDNGPPYEPINGNYQSRGVLCRIGKV